MKYSEPRYTKDLDVWVNNTPRNSARVYEALARFGAPLKHDGVTPETFTQKKVVYQIGVAPVRIDISTHIDGVTFDAAWQNRVPGSVFGIPVHFISLRDLIANKKSAGRARAREGPAAGGEKEGEGRRQGRRRSWRRRL